MSNCPAFPYGRFNATSTNLKLFPSITKSTTTKVYGSPVVMVKLSNGTFTPRLPLITRAVREGEQSLAGTESISTIPGIRKRGNIFSNTSYTMTKAQQLSYLTKFRLNR